MRLLKGVDHVAILTADVDRFIELYAGVFEGARRFLGISVMLSMHVWLC